MNVTRKARPRRRSRAMGRLLSIGALAGALAAYLLDRAEGHRRRRLARDRAAGMLRRGTRRAAHSARTGTALAVGRGRGLVYRLRPPEPKPLDDAELAHKVESILYRDPVVPKGRLNINAEQGTVFIRGEVESAELVRELEERVRKIAGVDDVENLLHLPGEPAPASHGGTKGPGARRRDKPS